MGMSNCQEAMSNWTSHWEMMERIGRTLGVAASELLSQPASASSLTSSQRLERTLATSRRRQSHTGKQQPSSRLLLCSGQILLFARPACSLCITRTGKNPCHKSSQAIP